MNNSSQEFYRDQLFKRIRTETLFMNIKFLTVAGYMKCSEKVNP